MEKFPSNNFEKALFFKKIGDNDRAVRFLKSAIEDDPTNDDILKVSKILMNEDLLQTYESFLGKLIDNGKEMAKSYFLLGELIIEYSPDLKKGMRYLKIARELDEKYSKYSQVAELIQWLIGGHILHSSLSDLLENKEEEKLLVRGILNNENIHSTNKVIVMEYAIKKGINFLQSIQDLVIKCCKSSDWRIRLSSIKALGHLENADYIDLIKDLIGKETERSNLPWYYWSIYNIAGDPTYFDSIDSLTKDSDPTVRLNATMVLGMCKSDKAIESLKKILYSEEPFTGSGLWAKQQAAKTLLEYNTEKTSKIVREAELLSSNLDTKLAARKAIEERESEEHKKRI